MIYGRIIICWQGKVKDKKIHGLTEAIKDSDLGPFSGGEYTGANHKSVKLETTPLESLIEGVNDNKVVLCKVVCSVTSSNDIP